MNLILAGVWLCLGGSIIAWQSLGGGDTLFVKLGHTEVSLGWVALFLAAYNLLRWWLRRQAFLQLQAIRATEANSRPTASPSGHLPLPIAAEQPSEPRTRLGRDGGDVPPRAQTDLDRVEGQRTDP